MALRRCNFLPSNNSDPRHLFFETGVREAGGVHLLSTSYKQKPITLKISILDKPPCPFVPLQNGNNLAVSERCFICPRACEILPCHKGCRLQDYEVDFCFLQEKKINKQGFEDAGSGLKGQALRWRTTPVMFVWDKMFVRRFRNRITSKFPATETR